MDKKKENVLLVKSFVFAIRIVKLYQYLVAEKKEYVLSKQLLRSGTAAFVGPSGAGKTTLVKLLVGLLRSRTNLSPVSS